MGDEGDEGRLLLLYMYDVYIIIDPLEETR